MPPRVESRLIVLQPNAVNLMRSKWAIAILGLLAQQDALTAGSRTYLVYDGAKYQSAQLERAAASPLVRVMQKPLPGQGHVLAKATDGHYYINGEVNGFPVTFMIDTGATFTAIPTKVARNSGIRAGLLGMSSTAGGVVPSGISTGNLVRFGNMTAESVTVSILDNLETPLLGSEVLNKFHINVKDGFMFISP